MEGQTYKIDSKRLGILDDTSMERAKQFLDEQKKNLSTSKTQSVGFEFTVGKSQKDDG